MTASVHFEESCRPLLIYLNAGHEVGDRLRSAHEIACLAQGICHFFHGFFERPPKSGYFKGPKIKSPENRGLNEGSETETFWSPWFYGLKSGLPSTGP